MLYLDANATTPVLPEVMDAMRPFWAADGFGNPSSAHRAGQRTRAAVERARHAVATLLHAQPKEVVFTSGGTESNNLALFGVLQPFLQSGEPAHLITTQIEHHAVLYAAEALEKRGVAVTYLASNAAGTVDPEAFAAALRPETQLVSVMLANNETGAVQPVGKLARLAKQHAERHGTRVLVHTDAVQAAGKLALDLAGEFKNVDLLSISGHKLYAPQGTGALFVRSGVSLTPLQFGGPHERGRRAGTENVPGIVALGRAAELAGQWLNAPEAPASAAPEHPAAHPAALAALRDRLEAQVLAAVPDTAINAASAPRLANTSNLRFPGLDAESLLIALDLQGVAASFGAACQSGATEPSHVLLAMGLSPAEARASLRLSLLRNATAAEVDRAAALVIGAVGRLRSLR